MRRPTLESLKRQAATAARFRGHRMRWLLETQWSGAPFFRGACRDCGLDVDVLTDPQANEANVAGPAVALHCAGKGN